MTYVNTEIADKYQKFFNFMSQEHGLILTISEMDEIIHEAQDLVKKFDIADVVDSEAEFCECDGIQDLIAGTGECRKCGKECTY